MRYCWSAWSKENRIQKVRDSRQIWEDPCVPLVTRIDVWRLPVSKWLVAFLRFLWGRRRWTRAQERKPGGGRPHGHGGGRAFPTVALRQHVEEGRPPELHWRASHPSTIRRFKAEVTCSRGHSIALRDHTVEADGQVIPSIVCKQPGCDFHEIVRLEGWASGRIPAQAQSRPVAA